MAVLATGHLGTDLASGALPALLPFLVTRFDLSYTLAAVLMLASTVSSSVVQPLFGLWSDRRGAIWLLPGGVALAGVGIALAAAAPAYWLVVALVVLSGLGIAAYHPEGSKFAAYVSGRRRASGMSAFSIGGNVGFAMGPVLATPLVLAFGLEGGLLLALPCLAIAALMLAEARYLRGFAPARSARPRQRTGGGGSGEPGGSPDDPAESPDRWRPLTLLLGVVAFRSLAWFGLVTFVPLWAVSLGRSEAYGNHLLALMLLAGGVGTVFAGPAADRFGRRPILLASLAASGPLTFVFVAVGGTVGAIALAGVGICVIGTFGVTMVMSQEYLPRHIGVASGLSIGLSIGLGGIAAVALGALADAVDLETALYVCAAAPVAGLALAALLPSSRASRRFAPEPVAP
jgi:MFS transporter, FSR family, fosmidomycin resistance protein